jgi:hypothetical protein
MRKLRYIALLLICLATVGCVNTENDIFGESAAERLNRSLVEDAALLQSASNGWVMEYFATADSPGYTLFLRFKKSGEVVVSAKSELTNNVLQSDSSLYQMIGDNGPVLTFNTFNKVMHTFSNPENPNGYGLEGDYEFIVMKSTSDSIELQGKKRGTKVLLHKMPNATSQSQYVADLDAIHALLFANNAPSLALKLTDNYLFSGGSSSIFSIVKEGADPKTAISANFIVTRNGIRLHAPLKLDGKWVQEFKLSDDKSSLVSSDNSEIKMITSVNLENLSDYLSSSLKSWQFDASKSSPKANIAYDLLVKSCNTRFYSTLPALKVKDVQIRLAYSTVSQLFALQLSVVRMFTQINGEVNLTSTTDLNNMSLMYNQTGDDNGMKFFDNTGESFPSQLISGYKEMVDLFSGNFTLSTEQSINPQSIKFVSKTDETVWFTVTCNSNL